MARGSLERGRGRGLKFLRAQAENSGPSINSFERGSEWRPWKKSEASLILSSMVGAVSTCVVAAGAAGALSPRPPSGIVIVQSNRVFICTVADAALPACAFDGSRLSSLDRPLA